MNKQSLMKKIEEVIHDKELDEDAKLCLINTYLKLSRKTNKKGK